MGGAHGGHARAYMLALRVLVFFACLASLALLALLSLLASLRNMHCIACFVLFCAYVSNVCDEHNTRLNLTKVFLKDVAKDVCSVGMA